ncbi:MAG: S46 family peptidase [Alloprevotella sp.]
MNTAIKKILLSLTLLLALSPLRADEGMWLLKLMEQQHLADSLRKAGLQLPPSALYDEAGPSLRDCVGIFGGGCTGEVVSPQGLVLTNHHCGFSYVHAMSTPERNYLQDGYFAQSKDEELPTPDLAFTFVLHIEDVTAQVEAAASRAKADAYTAQSQAFLEPLAEEMLQKSNYADRLGVTARIVPFFGANNYYLFYEQTYTDVRLVANPPLNIGQFGGNTDNWVWPRQNADFALFRIYADKDGQPADYNPQNQPLPTSHYLPIRLGGFDKGDYTMVTGFPGSTSRYLTAAEVQLRLQAQNQPIVLAGQPHLDFLKRLMDADSTLRLQLQDDYMGLGNMVKNFGGMNEAVPKTGLLQEKLREEAAFRSYAARSGKSEYADIIERIDTLCRTYAPLLFNQHLLYSTIEQQSLYIRPQIIAAAIESLRSPADSIRQAARQELLAAYDYSAGRIRASVDSARMQLLIPLLFKYKKAGPMPASVTTEAETRAHYSQMYEATVFNSRARLEAVLARPDAADILEADPMVRNLQAYSAYSQEYIRPVVEDYRRQRAELDRIYVRGLCEMYGWSKAPDANFTLRTTYGHVCDLKPRDGVYYDWRTVLGGMFEKESATESDYFVNPRLREFYLRGDYGRYAREDGQLPACFLSNNDITGGNSGSGVLNAQGELIGLAFDGNIESLSSDLKFNPRLQRCINVDIRYVLFIIDLFGGSSYAVKEMDIRENTSNK